MMSLLFKRGADAAPNSFRSILLPLLDLRFHPPNFSTDILSIPLGTLPNASRYSTVIVPEDSSSTPSKIVRSELFHQGGFVDRCIIRVEGGSGGDGGVHWIHRKHAFKLAAGGRGGDGGSVRLVASTDCADLSHLPFVCQAKDGGRGGQKQSTGARGAHLLLKVPPGTVVYDISHFARGAAPQLLDSRDRASSDALKTIDEEMEGGDADSRLRAWDRSTAASPSSSPSSPPPDARPGYGVYSTFNRFRIERTSPLDWIDPSEVHATPSTAPLTHNPPLSALVDESAVPQDEAAVQAAVNEEIERVWAERRARREDRIRFWDQYLGPVHGPAVAEAVEEEEDDGEEAAGGRKRKRRGPRWARDSGDGEEEEDEVPSHDQEAVGGQEGDVLEGSPASVHAMLARIEAAATPPPQMADVTREGQAVVVAMGGQGGKGNYDMPKNPSRPQPSFADPGTEGECRHLLLELKYIADIGLVGFPNAGKSTLLRCLTAAAPRVANYPFTTLRPYLGALVFQDGLQVRVADLPGIIEGASEDKGLGLRFLRHIERTRALAYVVDASSGLQGGLSEGEPRPWMQLKLLQEELRAYDGRLLQLPSIVVATKVDTLRRPQQTVVALRKRIFDEFQMPVFPVSHDGFGHQQLKEAFRLLAAQPFQLE